MTRATSAASSSTETGVERLLASGEPSIRLKTRRGVLGREPTAEEREDVRRSERVAALLSGRDVDGRIRGTRTVQQLLESQWPDGGWNCDPRATGNTSAFAESLLPLRALALHARVTGSERSREAAARCAEVFLARRLTKRLPDGGWPADGRFYGAGAGRKSPVDWGGASKRRSNEWVTADALTVLTAARRLAGSSVA